MNGPTSVTRKTAGKQWRDELRRLMAELLQLRTAGAPGDRLGHAIGMVDGYCRALVDLGAATQPEVLELVRDCRRAAAGPAIAKATRAA